MARDARDHVWKLFPCLRISANGYFVTFFYPFSINEFSAFVLFANGKTAESPLMTRALPVLLVRC